MGFTSAAFFAFTLLVAGIYFLFPKKNRWAVLLAASYLYYFLTSGSLLLLLIATTLITFLTALWLDFINRQFDQTKTAGVEELSREQKKAAAAQVKRKKQLVLAIGLAAVLGILAFLKYFNFFATNFNVLLAALSVPAAIPKFNLLLPLGISFYTFQSAGYLIDVFRGKIQADRNPFKFALFVSFFPQIVQGPISRYSQLAHQLYEGHSLDYDRIKFGAQLVLWGLFKKMVIADRAAVIVNTIFNGQNQYEGFTVFFGAMLYTLQIYGDFSGGIDVARGIAQIFGIDLVNNFARPLFATSIEDFWRRWHITLSSWMRDYVFYPLSLSRLFVRMGRFFRRTLGASIGKLMPTFTAMVITFLLVGIWHGANWKFVAYGMYNGLLIGLGILFGPQVSRLAEKLGFTPGRGFTRGLQILGTFVLVCFGRYFSRAASFMAALRLLDRTFSSFNPQVIIDGSLLNLGLDGKELIVLLIAIVILLTADYLQEKGIALRERLSRQVLPLRWLVYLMAIFAVLIFGVYGINFNASSFIYMGF